MRNKDLYLDLDIIDSAFSLGIGTPELFGLHPFHIKEIINLLRSRKIGSDIVELDPLCDNGNIPITVEGLFRRSWLGPLENNKHPLYYTYLASPLW